MEEPMPRVQVGQGSGAWLLSPPLDLTAAHPSAKHTLFKAQLACGTPSCPKPFLDFIILGLKSEFYELPPPRRGEARGCTLPKDTMCSLTVPTSFLTFPWSTA